MGDYLKKTPNPPTHPPPQLVPASSVQIDSCRYVLLSASHVSTSQTHFSPHCCCLCLRSAVPVPLDSVAHRVHSFQCFMVECYTELSSLITLNHSLTLLLRLMWPFTRVRRYEIPRRCSIKHWTSLKRADPWTHFRLQVRSTANVIIIRTKQDYNNISLTTKVRGETKLIQSQVMTYVILHIKMMEKNEVEWWMGKTGQPGILAVGKAFKAVF